MNRLPWLERRRNRRPGRRHVQQRGIVGRDDRPPRAVRAGGGCGLTHGAAAIPCRGIAMRSFTLGSLTTRSFVMKPLFVAKSITTESERIQHPPHLAFRWPLRFGRTLARGWALVAARRTARPWRMRWRVVEILQLECPAKPLQLKDQRRALRPDRSVIQCAGPAWRHCFVVVRTIDHSHDGTPSVSVFG